MFAFTLCVSQTGSWARVDGRLDGRLGDEVDTGALRSGRRGACGYPEQTLHKAPDTPPLLDVLSRHPFFDSFGQNPHSSPVIVLSAEASQRKRTSASVTYNPASLHLPENSTTRKLSYTRSRRVCRKWAIWCSSRAPFPLRTSTTLTTTATRTGPTFRRRRAAARTAMIRARGGRGRRRGGCLGVGGRGPGGAVPGMTGVAVRRRGAAVGKCAFMKSGMGVGDSEVCVMASAREEVEAV